MSQTIAIRLALSGVIGLFLVLFTSGCSIESGTRTRKGYNPPAFTGSISELTQRQSPVKARGKARAENERPMITLLVGHDAQGKPAIVEVRESCGDPSLDALAQDMVLKKRRFPKGKANTVLVRIDPKSLPKPPAPKQ